MAITQAARTGLKARFVAHDGQLEGTRTETGMIKVGSTLIIPPSTIAGDDTKSGVLAKLTSDERRLFQMPEEKPKAQKKTGGKRRTAATRPAQDLQEVEEPAVVDARVIVPGLGQVPTQYAHIWRGDGTVVLGLTGMSFVPPYEYAEDSGWRQVSFDFDPGVNYVNTNIRFKDDEGIENLLMLRVPSEPSTPVQEAKEEETSYDDDEE